MAQGLTLYWQPYRMFPYEQELGLREVKAMLSPETLLVGHDFIHVTTAANPRLARRLTYFRRATSNGLAFTTTQALIERTALNGGENRQATRYSVHGLHEYKGKFNPQVARAVLNCLGLNRGSRILDPFCGSGTTLVECAHLNFHAVGCDLNPLAVFIAETKLEALRTPARDVRIACTRVLQKVRRSAPTLKLDRTLRISYMKRWFSPSVLRLIEAIRFAVMEEEPTTRRILQVITSDLLRNYSLQEPTDLRIRKRKTPMQSQPLLAALEDKARGFVDKVRKAQKLLSTMRHCDVLCVDSTNPTAFRTALCAKLNLKPDSVVFNAVISSPPYASALPYIDTQRLSLIWLELVKPERLPSLQAELVGSREFYGKQKSEWITRFRSNADAIPAEVFSFCNRLQKSVSANDGFRRRAVPVLLYRYLVGMQRMLRSIIPYLAESAPVALIVGHNHTTLGGKRIDINTPLLLAALAAHEGYRSIEHVELQTYQRYSIHHRNAVSKEELLLFRKR